MTLNKNILFLPVLSLVVINNNNYANAATKKVDGLKKTSFFDRFYVKGNAYLGYSYSKLSVNTDHSGTLFYYNIIGPEYNESNNLSSNSVKNISSPAFGIGGNLYFKINSRFHAFLGVDATSRIIKRLEINEINELDVNLLVNCFDDYEYYKISGSLKSSARYNISYTEYAKLNAKLGMKIVLHKNFAIEPYALAGINFARFKRSNTFMSYNVHNLPGGETYYEPEQKSTGGYSEKDDNGKLNIGTIFGAGINFVFKERYTLGVEYWRSSNKFTDMSRNATTTVAHSYYNRANIGKTHISQKFTVDNIIVKFGIQF